MNAVNQNGPGWGRARAQIPSAPRWQTKEPSALFLKTVASLKLSVESPDPSYHAAITEFVTEKTKEIIEDLAVVYDRFVKGCDTCKQADNRSFSAPFTTHYEHMFCAGKIKDHHIHVLIYHGYDDMKSYAYVKNITVKTSQKRGDRSNVLAEGEGE